MHTALFKLLRLRLIAYFRRFATRGSTFKRVMGGVFAIFIVVSWIGPALLAGFRGPRLDIDPQRVLMFAPIALAIFVVMRLVLAAGSMALVFSPAEMDFLFPGPFSRRQLLIYKLLGGIAGGVFLSVIFAGQIRHFSATWLSGFIALLLSFMLMQFLGVAAALARQRLGQSTFGRLTIALGVVVLGALALAAWPSIRLSMQAGEGPPNLGAIATSISESVHASPVSRVVLAPFEVFAHVLISPLGPKLLGWVAAAAGILGLLLALVLRLDAAYSEAAIAASASVAKRAEVVKGGRLGKPVALKLSLPPFPWLGGAGPIVWRQLLGAIRQYNVVLFFVLVLGVVAAFMISMDKRSDVPARLLLIPMLFPLYLVLMNALRFDFRADLDRIDTLKTLPVRPGMVALGQVIVPSGVIVVLVGAAVLAVHCLADGGLGSHRVAAWTLLALAPGAVLLSALENTIFLYLPTRNVAGSASDMNTMLRYVGVRLLKLLALVPCAVVIGGAAALTWAVTRSHTAAYTAGWIALTATAAASVWGLAIAFKRFDPSRDMPA